ncbi:hypothetical protein [Pedobacter caeni]|uniref:Uncharacterized protein n=1 Tax=Pedobacter caeni TaxID=288992 RepID=A0A1M5F130_9SPHI|nr:hypothetical protein [Pedobacter caeni]SHF85194.1 hypothetical protein SAMN04488522_103890 [Pedobacter caeni]
MQLIKNITWIVVLFLLGFGAITLITASLSADVDGTDDYGFPFRFSRTGGRFLNMEGESVGAGDFYPENLIVDMAFVLVLVVFVRYIFLKYRASSKLS